MEINTRANLIKAKSQELELFIIKMEKLFIKEFGKKED
jgi:hypothetical protein